MTKCSTSRLIPPIFYIPGPAQRDSNGESIDREIHEGALKYTCRRYNLGINTGEGEEILDPEIKIPEESDFFEPEPLDQVVDTNRK